MKKKLLFLFFSDLSPLSIGCIARALSAPVGALLALKFRREAKNDTFSLPGQCRALYWSRCTCSSSNRR